MKQVEWYSVERIPPTRPLSAVFIDFAVRGLCSNGVIQLTINKTNADRKYTLTSLEEVNVQHRPTLHVT